MKFETTFGPRSDRRFENPSENIYQKMKNVCHQAQQRHQILFEIFRLRIRNNFRFFKKQSCYASDANSYLLKNYKIFRLVLVQLCRPFFELIPVIQLFIKKCSVEKNLTWFLEPNQ